MEEFIIKMKKYEILGKVYLIYIHEKENLAEFYIREKDSGIIRFAIGLDLNKMGINIEEFIIENIIDWIYFYNLDMKEE